MKNKVFIVDDHPFTRAGVRSILETNSTIDIIGEAEDGLDAVKQVIEKKPDLVVMDINMPQLSGIDATRRILHKFPDIKIIALSIHKGEIYVKKMLDAGAAGYLLKDEAPEELLKAIEKVNKGDIYLSSGVTRAALNRPKDAEELTKISVLQSKLQRPSISFDYVVRTKIIHELESNIIRPLSIVSAGAGFGKSIVVSQWLEQTAFLYSWISLDEEHNDFRKFLYYLIAAIEKVFPGLLEKTRELVYAAILPPDKELSNTLINELCDIDENFILVLDDYHLIKEMKIHNFLNEWLDFPPPCVHLCIIARRDPPLNIKSLGVSGRMTEIRMDDLSFNDEEIVEFFEQVKHVKLNDKSVEILQDKTEGWIISLRLVSMVTKSPEEIDQTLQFVDGGIHSLADYLLTEVLANQPEHIQDHLLTTSVLDRFCANLIEALIEPNGENDSGGIGTELMKMLHKSNLFIVPLDNEQKWFRYHHLFHDFLLKELKKRRNSNYIRQLHAKASLWFEQNNFITEAIIHEDKAGDHDRIVRIISDHWEDIIDRDQWVIVENWISYLSESLIDQSPGVLIAQVWIAQRSHKLELVPALIEKITNVKFELTDAQSGHLSFARCMLYYFINEPKLALDEANNALKLLPITHKSYRADTYSWWTFAMMMNGFSEQAMEQYQENLKNIKPKGEPIQSTRIMMHPAFLAITQADIPSMIKYNENFFGIQNISPYMMGWGLYIKAMICWWSYDLENCQKIFEEFLEYRYLSASTCAIDIYICLARLHSDLGNIDEARKAIRAGNDFANKIQDQAAMDTMASGNAVLNLSNNELKDAEKWLVATEAVPLNPTMFFWSEIPSITRVKVLITKGGKENINKALNLLEEYKDFSESIYNRLRIIDILVLQSLGHKKLGDNDNAIINLKKAVELSSNGQWIRPFAEQHVEISDLLLRLKDDGVHPNFIDTIFESIPTSKKATESRAPKEPLNPLTPSELKVLQCIAEGLRNKEIAEKLFNSEETIKKHIYNMFQKLYVKNRLSLITKAKELGILA